MTECPHGQEPGIHCPPCDRIVGHRTPDWHLVRRQAARYHGVCAADGCDNQIGPGDYVSLWADRHRDDGGLKVCCALCHPAGRNVVPLEQDTKGRGHRCPLCGAILAADHSREWRGGRMKPAKQPKPPRCLACGYVHAPVREASR